MNLKNKVQRINVMLCCQLIHACEKGTEYQWREFIATTNSDDRNLIERGKYMFTLDSLAHLFGIYHLDVSVSLSPIADG